MLRTAIETTTTPQEIAALYPKLLNIYRSEKQIIQGEDRIAERAWQDISFALHTFPIPPEQRNIWLMTLPPQVSAVYEATKAAEEFTHTNPIKRNRIDQIKDCAGEIKNFARRTRFKVGLMLLGR